MDLRRPADEYRSAPGPESMIRLLREAQRPVYTLCFRVLRHPQDSEDAAQQVLLKLIDELPRLESAEHVERWIHRVSFHVALNVKRARRRAMDLQRRAPKNETSDLEEEHADRLHEEISRLDPDLRTVVVEHYFDRRTLEQMAENRGCSTVAVWKKVEKARERLRVALSGALGAAAAGWLNSALEAQVPAPATPDLLTPEILAKAGAAKPRAVGVKPAPALFLGVMAAGLVGVIAAMRSGSPVPPSEPRIAEAARFSPSVAPATAAAPPPAPAPLQPQAPDLPDGVLARLGDVFIRHAQPVTSVAYSPDGKTLASCGGEELSLWDLAGGRELRRLKADQSMVEWVAYSPDGKTIAYAGNDHAIRLGDPQSVPRLLKGHVHHVFSLAFFPDGKMLASASSDQTIRIWDVASGKPLRTLEGHEDVVFAVAVSSDGWRVASRSQDRTVRVWNASTGEALLRIPAEDSATYPLPVAFSPDGGAVVFHDGGRIRFIGVQDGREIASVEDGDPPVENPLPEFKHLRSSPTPLRSLAFSPNGALLASGRVTGLVRIWDARSRTLKLSFGVPSLNSLAWSPDGTMLAVGGHRSVTFWDAATGARRGEPTGHQTSVVALAMSPSGETFLSVGADGMLQLWTLATGASVRRAPIPMISYGSTEALLAFSEGNRLTVAGHLKVEIRGLAEGAPVEEVPLSELTPVPPNPKSRFITERVVDGKRIREEIPAELGARVSGGLSRDGSRIALAVRRRDSVRLAVFDLASRKELASKEMNGRTHVRCVAFSPDRQSIALATEESLDDKDGQPVSKFPPVEVIDLSTGRTRASLKGHGRWVQSIAFSPDGSKLATASGDHTVRIWNSATGEPLATLKGHKGGVHHVDWSPDGATIGSAGYDNSVRFWHAETGLLLRSTQRPGLQVEAQTFDKDGRRFLTGMSDGTILIWSVPRP